jgi:hypothetical protein
MATWETVLLGVLVVLLLLWFGPGARERVKNSPKGTAEDWRGVLIPIGVVVLFVLLLIALA